MMVGGIKTNQYVLLSVSGAVSNATPQDYADWHLLSIDELQLMYNTVHRRFHFIKP